VGHGAGDEHGTDDQVGLGHRPLDDPPVRRQGHDAPPVDLVDPAEALEVPVEEQDLGLHALSDPGRVPSHVAGAEHDHACRSHAGGPAQQHSSSPGVPLEVMSTDLGRHAARHLAHRGEERQPAVGRLDGLVGQGGGAGVEETTGHLRVGGEVEVGEQHRVGPQMSQLGRLRLFDLHDQACTPGIGGIDQVGPGGNVLAIVDRRVLARSPLDQHPVPVGHQLLGPVGRECHPMLAFFGLPGDAHVHGHRG
jgi:hypothetical protein